MSPCGRPFSSIVANPLSTSACKVALKVIDEIHGISGVHPLLLEEVVGLTKSGLKCLGCCEPSESYTHIKIEPNAPTYSTTLCHEIGHFIDVVGFAPGLKDAPSNGLFKHWFDAVQKSEYYKKLSRVRSAGYINVSNKNGKKVRVNFTNNEINYVIYLMKPQELFARAYAQWLDTLTDNASYKAEFSSDKLLFHGLKQWEDDDFVPVGNEISNLFKRKGWITL
jgi:hypothetical protein